MRRRPRRDHSATLKAKVALDAIGGEKTFAELAKLHDVLPAQISDRKSQLLERAARVFDAADSSVEPKTDLKELHAKIGQQALEIDFLSSALSKARLLSAKRRSSATTTWPSSAKPNCWASAAEACTTCPSQ